MRWLLWAFLVALGGSTGCINESFRCTNHTACVRSDGTAGRCEGSGFCSFPVDKLACASGFRYGRFAESGLADQCVGESPMGDGGMVDSGGSDGGFFFDAFGQPELVMGGDFETGCSALSAMNGSIVTTSSDAHSGTGACQICSPIGSGALLARVVSLRQPVPGHKYRLRFWAKRSSGTGSISIDTELDDICGEDLAELESVEASWTLIEDDMFDFCVFPSLGILTIAGSGDGTGMDCIVIDELSLLALPVI